MFYPTPAYTFTGLADTGLGTLPTAAPGKLSDAMGLTRPGGRAVLDVSGACAITAWIWNPILKVWRKPGAATATFSRTFTAAGYDFFDFGFEGALVYFQSDTGGITGTGNLDSTTQGVNG